MGEAGAFGASMARNDPQHYDQRFSGGDQHFAVLICGPDTAIRYANAAAERLFSAHPLSPDAFPVPAGLCGQLLLDLPFVRADGSSAPASGCPIRQAITTGTPVEGWLTELAGSPQQPICVNVYPDLAPEGTVRQLFVTITPVSAETLASEDFGHLRMLRSLDRVHKAMSRSTEAESMMRDVLDALIAIFECDQAFLLYPCDPLAPAWEALMERARPGVVPAFILGQATPMDPTMALAMGDLNEAGRPMKFSEIGAESSPGDGKSGLFARSVLATAIQPKFGKSWMFGLCQGLPQRNWTSWEVTLLQEIGRRLSDSLIGLLAYRGLRDSDRKYREVFDNVSDSLVLFAVGDDGRLSVADINPAAEKIIGLKRRDILGKGLEDISSPGGANRTARELREVMASGEPITYDEELPKSAGGRILSTTLLPVRNEAGQVYRLIVISRDITDRKLAEDKINALNHELSQRVSALEKANNELENISYSVSHNMKIPLRAIDGFASLMLDECSGQLGGQGLRYLEVIRQSTIRLTALIDGLLDFIKLFSQPVQNVRVEMTTLVRDVFNELKARAPDRDIHLQLSCLPIAWGDRGMIRQILTNLLDNGIKFTNRRGRAVIEVGGTAEGDGNTYYVRDNGAGFDMRYSDKLFGVFFRLHSQEEFEGPGAGLAIVKRIIERHGGRIWAEGKVDEGATVHFTLPAPPNSMG
jgi:PAS domain S-box-containing protein